MPKRPTIQEDDKKMPSWEDAWVPDQPQPDVTQEATVSPIAPPAPAPLTKPGTSKIHPHKRTYYLPNDVVDLLYDVRAAKEAETRGRVRVKDNDLVIEALRVGLQLMLKQ